MAYVIEKVEWKGLLFHVKNNVFACYNRCIALIGIIFLLHFSRLERVLQLEKEGINRLEYSSFKRGLEELEEALLDTLDNER